MSLGFVLLVAAVVALVIGAVLIYRNNQKMIDDTIAKAELTVKAAEVKVVSETKTIEKDIKDCGCKVESVVSEGTTIIKKL